MAIYTTVYGTDENGEITASLALAGVVIEESDYGLHEIGYSELGVE